MPAFAQPVTRFRGWTPAPLDQMPEMTVFVLSLAGIQRHILYCLMHYD
jgi:hypothetical protein